MISHTEVNRTYPSLVPVSCLSEEDDVCCKVKTEPDDPGQVISQELQPHPVRNTLNSSSSAVLSIWLKPVCSTASNGNSERNNDMIYSKLIMQPASNVLT